MPEEFSKIDIDEPEDLDHVVSSIESHARKLVKAQLEREGQQVKADEETRLLCEKVIEQWVKNMRQRLESNLLVNGLSFKESVVRGAVEPFDQALATRVQKLSQDVDNMTEEAIHMRKVVPARREALLAARAEALEELRGSIERKRQDVVDEFVKDRQERADDEYPHAIERSDQLQETVKAAVSDVEKLATSVLETSSMTQQQASLIKRLRTMSD